MQYLCGMDQGNINKQYPELEENKKVNSTYVSNKNLILYNDEINTFDYVITCLIEVCDHDIQQAEQCAFLAHCKGKCDIKNGNYNALKPLKESLIEKGLIADIN